MTMKKIISVLAMALLVIAAAQAQEQVRKMIVRTDDGQVVKFKTANIEEVTFEEVAAPTTVEDAKAMLVGYWKCNDLFIGSEVDEDGVYTESAFLIVTEDLTVYYACKFADYIPDDIWYAEYAGKIVVMWPFDTDIIVNSADPTTGYLYLNDHENWGYWLSFKNLEDDSFDAQWRSWDDDYHVQVDGTFNRVEPFEYIFFGSKGLMKK
jgi:hypothetical protein